MSEPVLPKTEIMRLKTMSCELSTLAAMQGVIDWRDCLRKQKYSEKLGYHWRCVIDQLIHCTDCCMDSRIADCSANVDNGRSYNQELKPFPYVENT